MYKQKKYIGKYGIRALKINETLYLPIEKHGSTRSLCSYYKRKHGLIYSVNKFVDNKNKELIGVTLIKKSIKNKK